MKRIESTVAKWHQQMLYFYGVRLTHKNIKLSITMNLSYYSMRI